MYVAARHSSAVPLPRPFIASLAKNSMWPRIDASLMTSDWPCGGGNVTTAAVRTAPRRANQDDGMDEVLHKPLEPFSLSALEFWS
jgi:hypothetical protein